MACVTVLRLARIEALQEAKNQHGFLGGPSSFLISRGGTTARFSCNFLVFIKGGAFTCLKSAYTLPSKKTPDRLSLQDSTYIGKS